MFHDERIVNMTKLRSTAGGQQCCADMQRRCRAVLAFACLQQCVRQVGLVPAADGKAGLVQGALVADVVVLPEDAPVALRHVLPRLLRPVLLDLHRIARRTLAVVATAVTSNVEPMDWVPRMRTQVCCTWGSVMKLKQGLHMLKKVNVHCHCERLQSRRAGVARWQFHLVVGVVVGVRGGLQVAVALPVIPGLRDALRLAELPHEVSLVRRRLLLLLATIYARAQAAPEQQRRLCRQGNTVVGHLAGRCVCKGGSCSARAAEGSACSRTL